MGCSDIYCSLCGIPILQKSVILELCKMKFYNKSDIYWLKDCYSLMSNNSLYKKAIVEDCDMYFDETEYKFFSHNYRFNQIIQVHKLCYEIVEKENKIKLKYSDFINNSNKKGNYLLDYINYGNIEKYVKQEFMWNIEEFVNNEKMKQLLLNPLKNKQNKKRLLQIFKQFKIKPDRKGPNISETLFKNNTYLIGNDNYLWKIKNKKWTKIETIKNRFTYNIQDNKFNKILIQYLEKMNLIGTYNIDGICYNILIDKKNKNNIIIELIGNKDEYKKYDKIYQYLLNI